MKPIWQTGYSSTHEEMFQRHFEPSFNEQGLAERFNLEIRSVPPSGEFGSTAFNSMGRSAMQMILEFIQGRVGQVVVITGCDMRFYAPIANEIFEEIPKADFVSIWDFNQPVCGDFMGFVVSPKIFELYELMVESDKDFPNQQYTLNWAVMTLGLKARILPRTYWTIGIGNGGVVWNSGQPVNPPRGIKLHHANFTVGVSNKMELLDRVYSMQKSGRCGVAS